MEEHFRKSLGEDYSKLFKESEKKKEPVESSNDCPSEMEVDPVKAFKDDLTGYTGWFLNQFFHELEVNFYFVFS